MNKMVNRMYGLQSDRLKLIVIAALGGLMFSLLPSQAAGGRPHIIMFMSDDHSADLAGCYGDKVIRTPNLDALADEGMVFTHFFSVAPICGPSRTAIHTGMMPTRVGCWRNHGASHPDTRSLPHHLKALGYRVAAAGKMDVKPSGAFPF